MSKLAIMGTVELAPEKRDQVLPLLMAHRRRCLKDEPGTLQFEVVLPRDDHSRILIYELTRMTLHSRRIGMHRPERNGRKRLPAWASRFSQRGAHP